MGVRVNSKVQREYCRSCEILPAANLHFPRRYKCQELKGAILIENGSDLRGNGLAFPSFPRILL